MCIENWTENNMDVMLGKKIIVVSGVNIYTGGTLKVMRECLEALSAHVDKEYQIIVLVHKEELFPHLPNVSYVSFPKSRKSWMFRLYYEYIGFKKISKQLKPYCWFSMLDVTPNVVAQKRIVYCQSSFPFYNPGFKMLWFQYPLFLFCILFKYIYKINIKKNNYVIVQQEWIRQKFIEMYQINNIIVSPPEREQSKFVEQSIKIKERNLNKTIFFFPAGPNVHKNFDVICRAVSLLEGEENNNEFEVILTINGTENKYTHHLYHKYQYLKAIRWVGFLSVEEMKSHYRLIDCLLFPSKIETWGLPITEAKEMGIPLLLSDLPYAHETVGTYDNVKFFEPDNEQELARCLREVISGQLIYDGSVAKEYKEPFKRNWRELFEYVLPECK